MNAELESHKGEQCPYYVLFCQEDYCSNCEIERLAARGRELLSNAHRFAVNDKIRRQKEILLSLQKLYNDKFDF
jgi:hypothetical protein